MNSTTTSSTFLKDPPSFSSQHVTKARAFTSTSTLLKKGAKAARAEKASSGSTEISAAETEDPSDLSSLETGIAKVIEKLQNDLTKLRTGGRFNPELLEVVRVHLSKDSKATVKLGELAQVLPKGGRNIMVLVGEKDVSMPEVEVNFGRVY